MSREGWDDFGQDEPVRYVRAEEEPVGDEAIRHSGDELAAELDHWIAVFEEQLDSSIEEGWVHLRLELGPLLNLLAVMRGAAWVLRSRGVESSDPEEEG